MYCTCKGLHKIIRPIDHGLDKLCKFSWLTALLTKPDKQHGTNTDYLRQTGTVDQNESIPSREILVSKSEMHEYGDLLKARIYDIFNTTSSIVYNWST